MARYFFRFFTENNTAERHSKVFFNTDAKWLKYNEKVIEVKHLGTQFFSNNNDFGNPSKSWLIQCMGDWNKTT